MRLKNNTKTIEIRGKSVPLFLLDHFFERYLPTQIDEWRDLCKEIMMILDRLDKKKEQNELSKEEKKRSLKELKAQRKELKARREERKGEVPFPLNILDNIFECSKPVILDNFLEKHVTHTAECREICEIFLMLLDRLEQKKAEGNAK